jgi:hypothetical protein
MYSFSIAASFEAIFRGVLQGVCVMFHASVLLVSAAYQKVPCQCAQQRNAFLRCANTLTMLASFSLSLARWPLLCVVWAMAACLRLYRLGFDPTQPETTTPWHMKYYFFWSLQWQQYIACDRHRAHLCYFGGNWASRWRMRAETSSHDLARHLVRNHRHFFLNRLKNQKSTVLDSWFVTYYLGYGSSFVACWASCIWKQPSGQNWSNDLTAGQNFPWLAENLDSSPVVVSCIRSSSNRPKPLQIFVFRGLSRIWTLVGRSIKVAGKYGDGKHMMVVSPCFSLYIY